MEDPHPLSLEAKGDHLLAILWAHVGPILVSLRLLGALILASLKGPGAKHQVSWLVPGVVSPSSSKSRWSTHHHDLRVRGHQHPCHMEDQGAPHPLLKKMNSHLLDFTFKAHLHSL